MLKDLRRLTGANFLMDCTGAAAEADIADDVKAVTMGLWRAEARRLLDAVGWQDEQIAMRAFDGGATLQVSAPMDALYSATELVEAAWDSGAGPVGRWRCGRCGGGTVRPDCSRAQPGRSGTGSTGGGAGGNLSRP